MATPVANPGAKAGEMTDHGRRQIWRQRPDSQNPASAYAPPERPHVHP